MASRQRSNPLLGSMDGPAPQIVRSRAPHTSVIAEQRGSAVRTLTALLLYNLPYMYSDSGALNNSVRRPSRHVA